jgi:uncharacterized membrane protein
MYSKIKLFGHPIHPMLVAFPVAFYTGSLTSFIAYNSNEDAFWFKVGLVANIAGVIMAVVAALPGFIDWLNIPSDAKAKKTGVLHMTCNVLALVLFGINWWLQCDKWNDVQPAAGLAIPLTATGFILTMVAGFLGWTLVQKHHVGVDIPNREDN